MKFATNLAVKASVIIFALLMVELPGVIAEEIYDVTILQRETLTEGEFDLRMTLSLGNRQERLQLSENAAFSDLKIVRHDTSDKSQSLEANAISTYQGIVENLPDSWVRITTDGDHVNGVINTGTGRHFITSDAKVDSDTHLRQIRQLMHAVDRSIQPPPETLPGRNRGTREVIQIDVDNGFENQQNLVTQVAKIGIVVDNLFNEARAGRGLAVAISTINTVDGMYQQEFGLALKVDTAIIITDTTTLDLGNLSLEENLAKFRDYRLSEPALDLDLGLVHLFTGVTTFDPSVGLAYIGAACRRDGYDVSLSTPFDYPALLAAHEIGHNLGAVHDDETALCRLSTDQLMFSHISQLTTNEFSSCSIEEINTHLGQSDCHLDAIDLSLTLSRNGNTSVIALITNTDAQRAFPSAQFNLLLKNASLAAAPASCEIISTTELSCVIPTTLPNEDYFLEIELHIDESLENTLDASLEAIGFIDIRAINNQAQIVIPAETTDNLPISIANNDDTTTGSAEPLNDDIGDGVDNDAAGGSSGGGSQHLIDLFFLLMALGCLTIAQPARKQRMSAGSERRHKLVRN